MKKREIHLKSAFFSIKDVNFIISEKDSKGKKTNYFFKKKKRQTNYKGYLIWS